jgi:hypothetical protein
MEADTKAKIAAAFRKAYTWNEMGSKLQQRAGPSQLTPILRSL